MDRGWLNIDGILRPTMPFVGQAKGKGRFLNVTCLWFSNFANLNLSTAVMQRSVRVGALYPGRSVAIILS